MPIAAIALSSAEAPAICDLASTAARNSKFFHSELKIPLAPGSGPQGSRCGLLLPRYSIAPAPTPHTLHPTP
ncbi:MAG: hypothetical protein F6J93_00845 [Oscillatoria sp. SIO1A7]|nr:hypothetical protein [Oscillatoria sp. SIO1A7]